jgi:CRISPR-associated protein Cmr3
MATTVWRFEAADTLFFGTGKPMNAGESSWIDSQFPPTGLSLQGAVRTAVLYSTNADIDAFIKGEDCLPNNGGSLKAEIGDASSFGNLDLLGPFFQYKDELLFPVPLDLMCKQQQYTLLEPSEQAVRCDLGRVRLPSLKASGYKITENAYVSCSDMAKLLNGETDGIRIIPLYSKTQADISLADKEPKVGLARNNRYRTHQEGMLFTIAPVRLRRDVKLLLQVRGIAEEHLPKQAFLQKLGGEGKLAGIHIDMAGLTMPDVRYALVEEKIHFKLVFTQPALMPEQGWLPEGFKQICDGDIDCWEGVFNGCHVRILSACIGKPQKIGGWDLHRHESKPHQVYIPAGSVYFCEGDAKDLASIKQLHNSKLGLHSVYGFGHVFVGRW